MLPFLKLNPLTVAQPVRCAGEPATLIFHCYAQQRSFQKFQIDRVAEPLLFTTLLAWLEEGRAVEMPTLSFERKLSLWQFGLLISIDELKKVPPKAKPHLGDGYGVAATLCPEVADLLNKGPSTPPLPKAPNQDLLAHGLCNLPPVIAPADVTALRAFYRSLSDGDWLHKITGDIHRLTIHNDPAARRVQHALTPYFAALLGREIKPSYSYASEYFDESALPRHIDREQCEFTFSLYLDYLPDTGDDRCPWPITIHTPKGDSVAHQSRGGGVLFLGRALPHSRPPLPPGHRARLVFLHYVPATFSGSLD